MYLVFVEMYYFFYFFIFHVKQINNFLAKTI